MENRVDNGHHNMIEPEEDSPLRQAVKEGDLASVEELIQRDDIYVAGMLLHESAVSDDLFHVFEYLLAILISAKIDFETEYGSRLLYVACLNGSVKIATALLDAGCDVDVQFSFADEGYRGAHDLTPLHLACYKRETNFIELLIEKNAGLNTRDTRGRTPIYYTIVKKNVEGFRLLLKAGASLTIKDNLGFSPLQYATRLYLNSEVFDLIKYCFEDVSLLNEQAPDGRSVLMNACILGNELIVKKLIDFGADTTLVDDNGLLAIHLAARGGLGVFKLLLENTPLGIIENFYASHASGKWCSLPCTIIKSRCLESLKLLFTSGLSQTVLKCPEKLGNQILAPIPYLLTWNENEVDLNTLQFLLSQDYLIDNNKKKSKCPNSVNSVEAVIQRHNSCLQYCNCRRLLSTIINKAASPRKLLPTSYKRQLQFFISSAHSGFMEALHLIKYAQYVNPEEVKTVYLRKIFDAEYSWVGHEEEVIMFFLEKCPTDQELTFLDMKNVHDIKRELRSEAVSSETIRKYEALLTVLRYGRIKK